MGHSTQPGTTGPWRKLTSLFLPHDAAPCCPCPCRVHGKGVAWGDLHPFPWGGCPRGSGTSSWLLSPQCSFLPKFSIYIETKYEDNCGDSENVSGTAHVPRVSFPETWQTHCREHMQLVPSPLTPSSPPSQIFHSDKILGDHEVSFLDIAFDEIPERYYRSLEVTGFWGCPAWGPPLLPGSQPCSVP